MSRPVSIDIPHNLGAAEAKTRIEAGFGQLQQQIAGGLAQMEKHWEGDRLTFSAKVIGQAISGRLHVLDDAIKMEIDLPPMLAMIADTIKGRVKKQGVLLLEKK
jgi:putative polyhydroxyalkanoate system protein